MKLLPLKGWKCIFCFRELDSKPTEPYERKTIYNKLETIIWMVQIVLFSKS